MPMKDVIQKILEIYPTARATTAFGGPHEIQTLFNEFRREVEALPAVKANRNLRVRSSYGRGNWAAVPWLAIMDSRETDTTQKGTYIVFLFREDGAGCHFKLAQGVTDLQNAMSRKAAIEELKRRAHNVRAMFPEMEASSFDRGEGDYLNATHGLAELYEASSIYSKYWSSGSIPDAEQLNADIAELVDLYERFVISKLTSPPLHEVSADIKERRIWAIATGTGGSQWPNFLQSQTVAIGWDTLGDLKHYKNQEEFELALLGDESGGRRKTNNARCLYQFVYEISVGDYVVVKSGRKNIFGVGEVVSDYEYQPEKDAFKNIRRVKWLKTEPAEFPGTGTAIKTLTEITSYPTFVNFIKKYLELETYTENEQEEEENTSFDVYDVNRIIEEGCFLDKEEIEALIEKLRVKKNIILQGPPGTGKTWLGKRLAYALMGRKDNRRIRPVQFHANMSYEDFVRGWRPSGEGRLVLQDGPFLEAIEDARNSSQPYIVVIEEINRGSPAQIFGEMLTLLEANKRGASDALELTYRKFSEEKIYIPSNLYVIGTMNIADRSLALVDLAFRRRFAFIDLSPCFNAKWEKWLFEKFEIPEKLINGIRARVSNLNQAISDDSMLGPNMMIGHSYFIPPEGEDLGDGEQWYRSVIRTEVAPLLREYWFDSRERADQEIERLLDL
jgi:MoxR-like ATPase